MLDPGYLLIHRSLSARGLTVFPGDLQLLLVSPAYNIGLTTVANFWVHLLFLLAGSIVHKEEQTSFMSAELREVKGKPGMAPVATQSLRKEMWGKLCVSKPQLESAVGISVCVTRVFMPRAAVFAWWECGHMYAFAPAYGHPAGYHVSSVISAAF